jgi:hypothetical protein
VGGSLHEAGGEPLTAVVDDRIFRRNPRVEEAPLQGDLMLFDPETSKFFVLNRTMAFIWRHCDGEHSLGRMADALEDEFQGVPAEAARADLEGAVAELTRLGLIVDSRAAGG